MSWYSTYVNRRLIATLFLGFVSGLPLALTGGTLQAWFTVADIDLMTIGFIGLIGLPYIFKFLWAPLLDRFVPPWLGRRRGWILIIQIALIIATVVIAFLSPERHTLLMAGFALFIAFLSASHDIVIDAYRTDVLPEKERGLGAALTTIGFRIALIVSGGLALILADHIGWRETYLFMAFLMIIGVSACYIGPEPENKIVPPATIYEAVVKPFIVFARRRNAILILLFVLLYKLGDAFAVSLSSTFLLRELEFSLTAVGTANKVVGIWASIIGISIAGVLMTRMSLYWALMAFGVLQAISNLLFVVLAIVGHNYPLMVSVIFLDNVCAGLGTAAFVALLMSLCDKRFSATQYALLSAIAAIPRTFVGPVAALMVEHIGWVNFFWWSFIVALPCLFLLWWLRYDIDLHQPRKATAVSYG